MSDPIYNLKNVPLFEAIYGKHLISLGGLPAVEKLFAGLSLKGLHALDLGFGLGGAAFYLAKQHPMTICGVEVEPWMAEYATLHTPKDLSDKLTFKAYDKDGKIPFAKKSFDLVYSKGVLNHVHEKLSLFQEVNAVLKPTGLFVIADWLHLQVKHDTQEPLVEETKDSYQTVLEKAGFKDIQFQDQNILFNQYAKDLLDHLATTRQDFVKSFGEEMYQEVIKQHQNLLLAIGSKAKFATRILAKKP